MNSVNIVGRLTRDPELKTTSGGTDYAKMRIAVDRAGDKDDDGGYGAGFFNVTAWGRTAELCDEYLEKGRQVAISGELRFHQWEADDGSNRSSVEINARNVTFVGSRSDREERDEDEDESPARETEEVDDDIPF